MPAPRAQRLKSDKYAANINKRGHVPVGTAAKRQEKTSLGPFIVGLFVFVVIGSSVFQFIQLFLK